MNICPVCQASNREGAKFCDNCGSALEVVCPNCGTANRPDARFCNNCGYKLQAAPSAAPSAAPVAEPPKRKPTGELHNLIPREFAAKLESARQQGAMEGERRIVTILFCDTKGSTAAASHLDPEDWTEIINGAFERMISPVYKYEGVVARMMGDGILAFFGAPIAHEDDPARAILAGLDIIEGVKAYCLSVQQHWGVEINVRVGINTGLVVVGQVGNDLQMEYTAMGDAINLAARMEQSAQPGTVQIGEDTYKLTAPLFTMEDLGEIQVKGKEDPVHAYRPLRLKAEPGKVRGLESQGLNSPLVGREVELNFLAQRLEGLQSGEGAFVLVIGEAGLGKSRLIAELHQKAKSLSKPEILWLEGQSLSYRQSSSFYLWRQVIRQAIGALDSDPAGQVRERLNETSRCGTVPGGDVAFLETLLAVESEASQQALKGFEGESLMHGMSEATRGLLCGKTQEAATVLVFDDLHWADKASLDLLVNLADITRLYPLFIIGMLRPDKEAESWKARQKLQDKLGSEYAELSLMPLSKDTSRKLLSNLLAFDQLPENLRALILQKAEGNPFYVEEVIRSMIDSGVLIKETNGSVGKVIWRATSEVQDIDLPENLQTLLVSRIDRLEEEARHTLQLASVIGRTFYVRVLEAINQAILLVKSGLDGQLSTLEKADLILKAAYVPEVEYTFRHSITQEAAYNTILLKQRREFHQQVGETIERLFSDRQEEFYSVLAYHFGEAGDERSVKYGILAGDAAFRLYAIREAIDLYTEALKTLSSSARLLKAGTPPGTKIDADTIEKLKHLYLRLGRCKELQSDFQEALDIYEQMIDMSKKTGDQEMELAALIAQGVAYAIPTPAQDSVQAERMADRALELALKLGDKAAEAKIQWVYLILNAYSGRMLKAIPYGERSIELARQLGLKEQLAYSLQDSAFPLWAAGRLEDGRKVVDEVRPLWIELGNLPMVVENLADSVFDQILSGRFEGAYKSHHEALEISRKIGNLWGEVNCGMYIGLAYVAEGRVREALQHIQELLPSATEVGHPGMSFMWSQLIWLYESLGDLHNAGIAVEQTLDSTRSFLPFYPFGLAYSADYSIRIGDLGQAEKTLAEVEASEFKDVMINFVYYRRMVKARLLAKQGKIAEAITAADETQVLIADKGMIYYIPEAGELRADLRISQGELEEAHQILEEACRTAQSTNHRIMLWRLLAVQAQLEERLGEPETAKGKREEAVECASWIAGQIEDAELKEKFVLTARGMGVELSDIEIIT